MTSRSGNKDFDTALIEELKHIHRIMPINPGFRYVKSNNAFASSESVLRDTNGTVWIGLDLVNDLVSKDRGVSVAGTLAHECAHIFQFFQNYEPSKTYYRRLVGPTTISVELHADLLAGYYLGKKRNVTDREVSNFSDLLSRSGSYNVTDRSHHGYPEFRVMAMGRGFRAERIDKMSFEQTAKFGVEYVEKLVKL